MRLLLLFTILAFTFFSSFGQCPAFPITLSSQAEVDAFSATYPGCTEVITDITVSGNDITSLSGLNQINTTSASFIIQDNPLLVTANDLNLIFLYTGISSLHIINNPLLTDLPNITHGPDGLGEILLQNNPVLDNLDGFLGVTKLGVFFVEACHNLTSLAGIENLTSVLSLQIMDNQSLLSISELSGISGEICPLSISDNPVLQSLQGLEGATYSFAIGLEIINNDSLVDLTGLENFTGGLGIIIEGNDSLQSLEGLNSATESSIVFISNNLVLSDITNLETIMVDTMDILQVQNNPNLATCSLLNFCNFLSNDPFEVIIENNASGCNSDLEVLSNCQDMFFALTGNVAFDLDMNGCDDNDILAGNLLISAASTTNEYATITNNQGDYFMFLGEQGDYNVSIQSPLPTYFDADPVSQAITYDEATTSAEVDICIVATEIANDLKVTLLPTTDARPGFESEYLLVYENVGSTIRSGQIVFNYQNDRQEYVNTSVPPEQINLGELEWIYEDLLPFQSRSITVTLLNFEPPINEGGDELNPEVQVFPLDDDVNPGDNYDVLKQIMINSFDPNDKQVTQGEEIFIEQVGDFLNYIVRFQNIGTASAINVRVEDVLSANLNLETFRMLGSSHDYRLEIINGNGLIFYFDGIELPAEQDDEEGSNGYVAFQVRSNNDLQLGDSVENTADIYFDFNAPIITNTVTTTVVPPLGVSEFNLASQVILFPNPVSEILTIETKNSLLYNSAKVLSILGEDILETSNNEIDVSQLSSGVYFIEISTNEGSVTKKIIKE